MSNSYTRHSLSVVTSLWFQTTSKLGGGGVSTGYCNTAPIRFLLVRRVVTGIVLRTSASVHKCLRCSQACELTAIVTGQMGSRSLRRPPPSLTLLSYSSLLLKSSLTPSTLRTVRPSLPRLSVGGGRTRPGSRVALVGHSSPRTFRRSSWLPYTYSRVSPSPVSLPQVAPKLLFRTFLRGNTHTHTHTHIYLQQKIF